MADSKSEEEDRCEERIKDETKANRDADHESELQESRRENEKVLYVSLEEAGRGCWRKQERGNIEKIIAVTFSQLMKESLVTGTLMSLK